VARRNKKKDFAANPFKQLKGFVVSGELQPPQGPAKPAPPAPADEPADFDREMAALGVEPLSDRPPAAPGETPPQVTPPPPPKPARPRTEAEEFFEALGALDVRFHDDLPAAEAAGEDGARASARRRKQLRQGRIVPTAELDLHGFTRAQARERLGFFLDDSCHQGHKAVLVVTGKGQHSGGEPVLRTEVERWLRTEGQAQVVEWCEAPPRLGGAGALVLFLRGKA